MSTPVIDFEKIRQTVTSLSPEERAKKLEAFRSRQLLQQAKQKAKGGQAAYNKARNESFKQMKALALETPSTVIDPQTGKAYANQWEEIEAAAAVKAEAEFEKILDAETPIDATEND
jgi:hypothetical protein